MISISFAWPQSRARISFPIFSSFAVSTLIERITGFTIPQIFELYGEPTFRAYETEIVDRCIALDEAVVSCGGGTFINDENRLKLLERGPVVALRASPETIFERTKRSTRPLLQVPDPLGRINELLEMRKPFFDAAPIQVSTDGRYRKDVVAEIIARLEAWQDGTEFDPSSLGEHK